MDEELRSWYTERTGREPRDHRDIVAELFQEDFEQNPAERKFRDLVVEYAEKRGGGTLEYFRRRWSHYWGGGEITPGNMVAGQLGLSEEEDDHIVGDMMDEVWPSLKSSAEYRATSPPEGPG